MFFQYIDLDLVSKITESNINSHVLVATSSTIDTKKLNFNDDKMNVWPITKNKNSYCSFPVGPEQHVGYAVSWYGMALFGLFATYKKFKK